MPSTPRNQTASTPQNAPAVPGGPAPASQGNDSDRVKELEAENAQLRAATETTEQSDQQEQIAALREEVGELREKLAAVGQPVDTDRKPKEPSFGLSEGQRAELAATGRTVSPFTGARQVGTGKPGEKPRVASAVEFEKASAKPARTRQ